MPSLRCLLPVAALVAAAGAHAGAPPGAIFANGFEPIPVVTVFEVQSGFATGVVSLQDRVVTARSRDQRNLWIADAGTAVPYEGLYVFRGLAAEPLPAEVAIGTRVDIVGTVEEFDFSPPGDTLTELTSATVVLSDPGPVTLVPIVFSSVAQLASIADGEAWEGVLVRVDNVKVQSLASGNRVVLQDAGATQIVLDDDASNYAPPVVGTCYANVTGVMHINLADNERRLLPRGPLDFVAGNTCN